MAKRPIDRRLSPAKEEILVAADRLFGTSDSVSVRNIAATANVADGLVIHHFGSYAGLVAALTERLNERETDILNEFEFPKARSQLEKALAFFRALAELDLSPENARLRRMSCKMSWDWGLSDESMLAGGITTLLEPLRKHLKFNGAECTEALMVLWAIYLLPLRLALNHTLLPPSTVRTQESEVNAIIDYLRPKFALILGSD